MVAVAAPSGLPHRLGVILNGVRRVLAVRPARDRVLAAMLIVLWNRLSRTLARVCAIAARHQAGTLHRPPASGHGRPAAPPPRDPLPRRPSWVVQWAPECAAYAENLRWLLAEPEVAAMVAAAPHLRRLLRPLWRMLQAGPPPQVLSATPDAPERPPRRTRSDPGRITPATPAAATSASPDFCLPTESLSPKCV